MDGRVTQNWTLDNDRVSASFDPDDGARLTSLVIDGHELLVTDQEGPAGLEIGHELWWGAFVMAPWTSDIRNGTFTFRGEDHRLPLDIGTAAVHGVARKQSWTTAGDRLTCTLGEGWPFGGTVIMAPTLLDDGLHLHFSVLAERPMPAAVGWHPWFRRQLETGSEATGALTGPARCQDRDEDGVPTGLWKTLPRAPWNDCLRHNAPVTVTWPGVGTLTVEYDSAYVTIFSSHERGVCVEPVTSPAELMLDLLEPGEQLDLNITLQWRPHATSAI